MEPVNVIYQTAEDGLSDTIKPRLVAAGADCARVMVIDDSDRVLTLDDDRLEQVHGWLCWTRFKAILAQAWICTAQMKSDH